MEAEREERDVGGEVRANLMGEVGNHILARRLVGDEDDATRESWEACGHLSSLAEHESVVELVDNL